MPLRLPLRSLTLSILLLASNAAAQTPQAPKQSEEDKAKARKELERKALALLDETLQGTQALKLAENRAALRAQAADLLWARDEKRARALFREAVTDIVAAQSNADALRERGWMYMNLRAQLLYTAAARDAQFALELLRESRPQPEAAAQAQIYGEPDGELRLEQALVSMAADSDPKAALRMAEESLSRGVTYGVIAMLEKLRAKDSESATRFAGEVVAKLRGESLSTHPEAMQVAFTLLRTALMPQSSEQSSPGPQPTQGRAAEKPKPLVLEDGDLRDLIDVVTNEAFKDSTPGGAFGMLMNLRPLMPEIEKRAPARAAQLRLKLAEVEKTIDPRMRAWEQFDSARGKSADAILEAAAKAPAEMRGSLVSLAAMKLMQSGDVERARQVITDEMRGQERDQMLAYMDRAELERAIKKGDTEAAKAAVSRVKSKERRAAALAELAVAFALKEDRKSALQLLEEARGLVERQPESEKGIEALLEVARGYALVEPSKTFELIDPLIDRANDLLTAAALLEKFGSGGGLFRKGEMILSPTLEAAGGPYARYVKALSELARVDFDRTKTTADRFGRDEARLAARLVVARSVLSDRLDASSANYGGVSLGGGFSSHTVIVSQ
ncbi:MAG TPA: hypothetical protein VGP08_13520 [Pyrinomonadaceae bacterium]|jgi:hypothetical protein|nr:hypothetical protein [Pyrinomonadaceae bacterium]